MRKRILTNTYQLKRKQLRSISPNLLRRQAGGQAVRTHVPETMFKSTDGELQTSSQKKMRNMSDVRAPPIPPKETMQIPRELVMLAISKKQNELKQ